MGEAWGELLARDTTGALVRRLGEVPDGQFQTALAAPARRGGIGAETVRRAAERYGGRFRPTCAHPSTDW